MGNVFKARSKNGIASLQKLDEICVLIGKETNLRYH